MNIHESRNSYYHIKGVNTQERAVDPDIETVEQWARRTGNKPTQIKLGVSGIVSRYSGQSIKR